MTQKIAVAIIHGAGLQEERFSKGMQEALSEKFHAAFPTATHGSSMHEELVFSEVHWAGVLTRNAQELDAKIKQSSRLRWNPLRDFVLHFYADTIAYQPGRSRQLVYDEIHDIFATALKKLSRPEAAGPEAPLCLISHSLGTIISHNYLYDLQDRSKESRAIDRRGLSDLEKGRTLALFVTMGSPLALWSLRYAHAGDYSPIQFPGSQVTTLYPDAAPKWFNMFDKDDVLAFPVEHLSQGHRDLAANGLLEDRQVNIGSPWTSWTPASHLGYWTDNDVTGPLAEQLVSLWKAVNPGTGEGMRD